MSGGHFDHKQFWIREIADTIERDIAMALQPKPKMVREDYWTIDEMDCYVSSHTYLGYYRKFESFEEAEAYLTQREEVVRAETKYAERFFTYSGRSPFTFSGDIRSLSGMMAQS